MSSVCYYFGRRGRKGCMAEVDQDLTLYIDDNDNDNDMTFVVYIVYLWPL